MLGQILSVLGEHAVSIAQVAQDPPGDDGEPIRVVVRTHEAREGDLRQALERIAALPGMAEPARVVRLIHTEPRV